MGQPDLKKYLTASSVANEVLRQTLAVVASGISVHELCSYGDALVQAYAKSVYRKDASMEKGLACPTTVSVNNLIQNYSPDKDKDYILREGDMVKIEINVHINGFIASSAHTIVINSNPSIPVTDRRADAICAAHFAAEAALRLFKPGNTSADVRRAIQMIAAGFNCHVVDQTYTAQVDQFVLHGLKTFANRTNPEEAHRPITFETDEVYTLDVVISTGPGHARQGSFDPTIYQRDVNVKYNLKLRSSRVLFSEICSRYSVFPFLIREVAGDKLRVGVPECANHGLLVPFAVTSDDAGSWVAQFKLTVMSHFNGPIRLTEPQPMSYVHSAIVIPPESEIGVLLQQPFHQKKGPELPRLSSPPWAPVPRINA